MKLPQLLIAFLLVSASIQADEYQDSLELRKKANAWTNGEPIPFKLLEYRSSHEDGSCFPNPAGTESIFFDITNYPLLKKIVFQTNIDSRVFTNTVNKALVVAGPSRFFQDTLDALKSKPDLLKIKRFKVLEAQAHVKHIVVDSLYITYADMPAEKIKGVLAEIEQELISGRGWGEVYKKWSAKLECPYEEKLNGGTIVVGTRTKIGNLGDFVLPKNKNKLFSYREDWIPKAHLKKLFSAHQDDILILFDKEDLARFSHAENETGERYVLHRVREIWPRVK